MSQADSINTTSRRGFLARGAAAVAGGATILATPAIAEPFAIQAGADPIFAAIEAHQAARAALYAAFDTNRALEEELPHDKRQSRVDVWREEIVETDDPRWIAAERGIMSRSELEDDAAVKLVSIRPTTQPGLLALLQYALLADVDGEGWPNQLVSDDGKHTHSWQYFLIENIAVALTLGTTGEMQ
jgi:hypothetical protein